MPEDPLVLSPREILHDSVAAVMQSAYATPDAYVLMLQTVTDQLSLPPECFVMEAEARDVLASLGIEMGGIVLLVLEPTRKWLEETAG